MHCDCKEKYFLLIMVKLQGCTGSAEKDGLLDDIKSSTGAETGCRHTWPICCICNAVYLLSALSPRNDH